MIARLAQTYGLDVSILGAAIEAIGGNQAGRTRLELPGTPAAVPDVDAAFVTISFALPAALPADDAILIEGKDSPYSNLLATSPEPGDDPRVQKLLELLLSEATQQFMVDTWGGLVVPGA